MAHILVIDDDEMLCELIGRMFEETEHHVSTVLSGDAALAV